MTRIANMSGLPGSNAVNVGTLSGLFNDRTNSYKYLFFIGLLQRLEEDGFPEPAEYRLDDVAIEMLVTAWFPAKYFKLSFGVQDQVHRALHALTELGLPDPAEIGFKSGARASIRDAISRRSNQGRLPEVRDLRRYVPYRLLRPFFAEELKGQESKVERLVPVLAENHFHERMPLYQFMAETEGIELHPHWVAYFKRNLQVVKSWAYWEWLKFMEARNKRSPGIAHKLVPPRLRAALSAQRGFWRKVLAASDKDFNCIFTGENLEKFDLDHFLPWTFVVHDELWNLVPVSPSANGAKGNSLPDFPTYLERFVGVQHQALTTASRVLGQRAWEKRQRVYHQDLGIRPENILDEGALFDAYKDTLEPLRDIAESQGFQPNWRYAG
jgi:hypothetical protein